MAIDLITYSLKHQLLDYKKCVAINMFFTGHIYYLWSGCPGYRYSNKYIAGETLPGVTINMLKIFFSLN